MFRENVVGARIWLFTIKLIEGKVSEEEKKNMIDFLSTIISKKYVASPNP
jgi:phenylpyruvate tautomerase PptA (4-oxalocrotonate tautomerase family)